jgi:catechol 2,3-dioxygenase-like lactoylglutathione lyase family enzyme
MLGRPVQIAYGVDDVRTAATRWVAQDVGPFFVIDHIVATHVRIDGDAATFDHSSAYGWWGDVMIELICQHGGNVTVVPPTGLHHVAFFVDDMSAAQKALVSSGRREVLYAETANGQAFAMHDARSELGHLIEIYEPTPRLTAFYDMVRDAATHGPGTDPIRTL